MPPEAKRSLGKAQKKLGVSYESVHRVAGSSPQDQRLRKLAALLARLQRNSPAALALLKNARTRRHFAEHIADLKKEIADAAEIEKTREASAASGRPRSSRTTIRRTPPGDRRNGPVICRRIARDPDVETTTAREAECRQSGVQSDAKSMVSLLLAMAERLWALADREDSVQRLIMPHYVRAIGHGVERRTDRLSEQEVRQVLTTLLEGDETLGWHYSVETPTVGSYRFTTSAPAGPARLRSALSDLSLYRTADPASRFADIELKAHNPDPQAYAKDFEKLWLEPTPIAAWVQVLAGVNAGTLPSVFSKITAACDLLSARPIAIPQPKTLILAFCVIDQLDGRPASGQRRALVCPLTLTGEVTAAAAVVMAALSAAQSSSDPRAPWVIHRPLAHPTRRGVDP